MKQNQTQLINNIIKNMAPEEIKAEINNIENSLIHYGEREFLKSNEYLTEDHYKAYRNRMESYQYRKTLLELALEKITKIEGVSNKYNVSKEIAKATVSFFAL